MTQRGALHILLVRSAALLTVSACAQATFNPSASDVLSAVILAGTRVGTHTSTDSRAPASTRTRSIPDSPAPTATISHVLKVADQYIGVPYTWGGNTPRTGFDCSGFTKYVFAQQGIQLPRTSREQSRAGAAVRLDFGAFLPGDLLLFAEHGEAISHVAIYVGSGEIIHSSSGYHGVNYLDLNTTGGDWYVQNLVAARRLTSNGRSLVQSLEFLTIPNAFDPPDRAAQQR